MEFYCEDRYINFPPDVEFKMNGVDAGEFFGTCPGESPIGTPPDTSHSDWDQLSQEIFTMIQDAACGKLNGIQPLKEFEKPFFPIFANNENRQMMDPMQLMQEIQQEPLLSCTEGRMMEAREPMQQFQDSLLDTDDFFYHMFEQELGIKPRRFRKIKDPKKYCVFCKNNNETPEKYMSHSVKDAFGKVTCPRLYRYVCPICYRTGADAHTTKYCPDRPIVTMEVAENLQKKRNARRKIEYYA